MTNQDSPQAYYLKSPQSKFRSVRTQPDQEYSESLGASKKLSLHQSAKKRLKTDIPQRINFSVGLKQKRKRSQFPKIKQALHSSENSKLQLDKSSYTNQADQLSNDPYLNGKIRLKIQKKISEIKIPSSQHIFLQEVKAKEKQFLVNCINKKYSQAAEILVELFNYSIDLDLIHYFSQAIMILGDFYLQCNMLEEACFYINEARKCFYETGNFKGVVEATINIGQISMKMKMYQQAEKFMKKSLQYAWYSKSEGLQLKIYQQMGRNYFMMGDCQKAKKYHMKYFSCGLQPKNSAIKLSSNESLRLQGIKQKVFHKQITQLFIIKTSAPIKQYETIPKFISQYSNNIRGSYYRNLKYFGIFKSARNQIKDILQEQFYRNQIGDMHITGVDWTAPIRRRKFLSFDIQRNKHLQQLGIRFSEYFKKQKNSNSLKLNFAELGSIRDIDTWCSKFVSRSHNSHSVANKAEKKNRVQLRGLNGDIKTTHNELRLIYNKFFD